MGHLFTRKLDYRSQESGPFDPDPEAVADAYRANGHVYDVDYEDSH